MRTIKEIHASCFNTGPKITLHVIELVQSNWKMLKNAKWPAGVSLAYDVFQHHWTEPWFKGVMRDSVSHFFIWLWLNTATAFKALQRFAGVKKDYFFTPFPALRWHSKDTINRKHNQISTRSMAVFHSRVYNVFFFSR